MYVSIAILDMYFAASVLTFFAYAFDNSAAQNNCLRTQESTLHLLGGLVAGLELYLHRKRYVTN
ncbi:hypothetical protein NTGBS_30002 [Candidatus Nitrotoga sp. BS]|nr:hypothetical protein NTGBS_30002 [Candidatus Nitrotoga sp. BS]